MLSKHQELNSSFRVIYNQLTSSSADAPPASAPPTPGSESSSLMPIDTSAFSNLLDGIEKQPSLMGSLDAATFKQTQALLEQCKTEADSSGSWTNVASLSVFLFL